MGGNKYTAILPRADERTAAEIIKRIRQNIDHYNREHGDVQLELSMGVATAVDGTVKLSDTYKWADDMMYHDKLNRGARARNKIVQNLLAALAERDFIIEGHTIRLEKLCRQMGENAWLSPRQLSDLVLLVQVHDLGKVGIPDHILFKEGPLTEKEWELMRQHPEKGYRIALSIPELAEVADFILKHHERWDGQGYPLGLEGDDIPIECRILAITDAFDAMTSLRHYSKALSKEEAVEELKRCAGSQFDPRLVNLFLTLI